MEILDCKRLLCPMPVIRVQDRIATMQTGEALQAICTDPGAMNDIPSWCRVFGHEVIEAHEEDDLYYITVRVGATD